MAANEYHFVSDWRVLGTAGEVFDIIADSKALPLWWPAAFLDVLELEPGDENGIGAILRLETKGWLPYILHWHLRVDDRSRPSRLGFHVWGDFEGRGLWQITQAGAWTDVHYDWPVKVQKPLVRYLSFLIKPLFASNHRWTMAKGEESLRLELARRHMNSDSERSALPPPPPPSDFPWTPLAAVVAGGLIGLIILRRRR